MRRLIRQRAEARLLAMAPVLLALAGCDAGQSGLVSSDSGTAWGGSPPPLTFADAQADGEGRPATKALKTEEDPTGRFEAKTFDDIRFDIEPDAPFDRSMLTEEIEQLVGRPIRIRGWMLPPPRDQGIKQFVLVRDNKDCCFGPGAALYDCILVQMLPGKTTEVQTRPIAVEGTFKVQILPGLDDNPLAIYQLDAESVER